MKERETILSRRFEGERLRTILLLEQWMHCKAFRRPLLDSEEVLGVVGVFASAIIAANGHLAIQNRRGLESIGFGEMNSVPEKEVLAPVITAVLTEYCPVILVGIARWTRPKPRIPESYWNPGRNESAILQARELSKNCKLIGALSSDDSVAR